jgi:hypothetical protein
MKDLCRLKMKYPQLSRGKVSYLFLLGLPHRPPYIRDEKAWMKASSKYLDAHLDLVSQKYIPAMMFSSSFFSSFDVTYSLEISQF